MLWDIQNQQFKGLENKKEKPRSGLLVFLDCPKGPSLGWLNEGKGDRYFLAFGFSQTLRNRCWIKFLRYRKKRKYDGENRKKRGEDGRK